MKGGVRLTSSDGVDIQTAELHFDGNRLTNHIPVQFKVDRWTADLSEEELAVGDFSAGRWAWPVSLPGTRVYYLVTRRTPTSPLTS